MSIEKKYSGSFKRTTAASIDAIIVLILRILTMQSLALVWINKSLANFAADFSNHFGTEAIKNTPEHINFIIHHRMFYYAIIFYSIVIFVGALYHAYLNSSLWQATIGKRLMKIIIIKEDNHSRIGLGRGLAHYFLSVLPFVYITYLLFYQVRNNLDFFHALTATEANVFFGVVFAFWAQIHIFTKKKTTAYDLICNTTLIEEKTSAKLPWRA